MLKIGNLNIFQYKKKRTLSLPNHEYFKNFELSSSKYFDKLQQPLKLGNQNLIKQLITSVPHLYLDGLTAIIWFDSFVSLNIKIMNKTQLFKILLTLEETKMLYLEIGCSIHNDLDLVNSGYNFKAMKNTLLLLQPVLWRQNIH